MRLYFSSQKEYMVLTANLQPLELRHEPIPSALQIFLNCQLSFHLFESLLLLYLQVGLRLCVGAIGHPDGDYMLPHCETSTTTAIFSLAGFG
jgi:hypothetical protein